MRVGLFTAVSVVAYAILVEVALRPLHAHGTWQSLLGFLNGLDRLVQIPGTRLTYLAGFRSGHHPSQTAWLLGTLCNSAVYGLAAFLLRACGHRLARVRATVRPLEAKGPVALPARAGFSRGA